ncbi:MAG TPA: hypothetical protein VGD40_25690 [Chryseosolibacter sp.]
MKSWGQEKTRYESSTKLFDSVSEEIILFEDLIFVHRDGAMAAMSRDGNGRKLQASSFKPMSASQRLAACSLWLAAQLVPHY